MFTIAQNSEKTTSNTITTNYESVKFPSERALILQIPFPGIIPIVQEEMNLFKTVSISNFEDKVYQTLVQDNLLRIEKSTIVPLSSAILNLKNFAEKVKLEIKNFRESEDDRLEEISYE